MKMFEFRLKIHWYLFLGVQLDNGWSTNRRQTIIWTNADPIDSRIYAALGGEKLSHGELIESFPRHQYDPCITG